MTAWRAAAALLLFLAGCLSGDGGDGGDGRSGPDPMAGYTSPDDPIPVGSGHDHKDPAQHRFARNATLLDADDLRRFGVAADGVVGAHVADLAGDLLAVGVNAGEEAEGQHGVHVFSVAEPGTLEHLSFWESDVPVNGDRTVVFSADAQTVFLGFEGPPRPGVAAIDVSDPANPVETAFWPDPLGYGPHTLSAGVIDGRQYVFLLSFGITILEHTPAGFQLAGRYVTQDGLAAADLAAYLADAGEGAQTYLLRSLYGHDMEFFQDNLTGKPLLLVAYAYDGAKILDLTVPAAPVPLASWVPPKDSDHRHYVHSMAAERQADGRLLVVVGSETFEPQNQAIASPVWMLDATDAVGEAPQTAAPRLLGTWRNPGGAPAGNLGLSVHFFRIEDGVLYLSHYHGGVWAIDVRDGHAQRQPEAFGYIMPVPPGAVPAPEGCCIGFDLDGVPMVFDVEVKDRVAYATDIIQGVTAIRFGEPGAREPLD